MFFQDSNAPVHGAKIVTDWENENLIIFFHGQSRTHVRKRDPRPKSTNELISALQESRSKIFWEI